MHRVHNDAARLAARRAELAALDTNLTAACERAAGRGRRHHLPPSNPATWNQTTWRRYLAEAAAQGRLLAPEMRRLAAEIDLLEQRTVPGRLS